MYLTAVLPEVPFSSASPFSFFNPQRMQMSNMNPGWGGQTGESSAGFLSPSLGPFPDGATLRRFTPDLSVGAESPLASPAFAAAWRSIAPLSSDATAPRPVDGACAAITTAGAATAGFSCSCSTAISASSSAAKSSSESSSELILACPTQMNANGTITPSTHPAFARPGSARGCGTVLDPPEPIDGPCVRSRSAESLSWHSTRAPNAHRRSERKACSQPEYRDSARG